MIILVEILNFDIKISSFNFDFFYKRNATDTLTVYMRQIMKVLVSTIETNLETLWIFDDANYIEKTCSIQMFLKKVPGFSTGFS